MTFKKYEKVFREDYEKWYRANEAYRNEVKADPDRLSYHLMPETGWLNDPNGLPVIYIYEIPGKRFFFDCFLEPVPKSDCT